MKILITGATGFLGGATTTALIHSGYGENLRFLIRAGSAAEGLQRLHESLLKFEVTASALLNLRADQIIVGELQDVDAFATDKRLDDITHVVNCAAVASFGKHPGIWPVNVEGTLAFALRMSRVKSLQRFLHVSTAMACGSGKDLFVEESWDFQPDDKHLVPYTASKAAAEQQLKRMPSLPLVVVRPSIIVGHTQLGCKPSTSIFWVFRMVHDIEHFMCELDECIDVVPVDYCAAAIEHLLLKPKLQWDLYHLSAGQKQACTIRSIDAALAKARNIAPISDRYRRIDEHEIKALIPLFQKRLGINNRRILAKAVALYGGFSALHYVFNNHRLLSEGVPPPPPLTSYIDQCVATTEGIPLMDQMLNDFK